MRRAPRSGPCAVSGVYCYRHGVRALIIEIEHREVFVGEDLYPAVDGFLQQAGFRQAVVLEHDGWYSNYLYLRRESVPAWGQSS